MDLGLTGKICIVTGSTVGHRARRRASSCARTVRSSSPRAAGRTGSATSTSPATCRRRASQNASSRPRVERFGRVDVLVNNVGGTAIRRLEELTDADWQVSFELNLMTAIRATRAAVPVMREHGGGAIVNVSSTSAKRPSATLPEYSVMKAGLLSYSRLVADSYAGDGIRCNAVTPGPTGTEAWLGAGGLADQQGDRDAVLAKVGAGRPLGRLAEPEEIAAGDRLPLLGACVVRHRRRLERRRRHRPDHHLIRRSVYPDLDARALLGKLPTPSAPAFASWRRPRCRRSPCARTRRAAASATRSRCTVRTPFQRDRDRILHSKPFRRLKGKTQVFIDPAGDHYRTRMTHTLETTGIARVVARALRLNEDLTEAIGLGHDMGHPPFGHAGEAALDLALREHGHDGFRHNEQSARIARRLNLTYEVVDGILTHTGPRRARDARGKDRAHRRPGRVHQPRHRRRDPLRDPRRGRPAGRRDRGARRDAAPSASTRLSTTSSSSPRVAGDIVQSDEVGGRDARAAGVHVRARLPRARTRSPSTSARRPPSGGSSSTCSRAVTSPRRSPSSSPG